MKTFTAQHESPDLPPSNHLLVLIPGFLGFNRLGDFSYFADRVGQTLANELRGADPGRRVHVVAVDTVPAGPLQARQEHLVRQLQYLRMNKPQSQLHLVGHSTGGLDAELLVRTPWLGGKPPDRELQEAVRSVCAIAAPLAGTSLATSSLAQLLAIDSPADLVRAPLALLTVRGPAALASAALGVLGLLPSDRTLAPLVSGLLHSLLHNPGVGSSYVLSLLLSRSLIDDLAPERTDTLMRNSQEDPTLTRLHRAWFLTTARTDDPRPRSARWLFRQLYATTRGEARPSAALKALAAAISQARLPVVGQPPLPPLQVGSNDGVVNTLRQVPPCQDAADIERQLKRIAAIAIADHIDVIGYFPHDHRHDAGFLSSGSNFSEAAFGELYQHVAQHVAASIHAFSHVLN